MAPSSYTAVQQRESVQNFENCTIQPPQPTISGRCYLLLRSAFSSISTAILLITAVVCLAALAGFVASKVFIWSLIITTAGQPRPQPEAFFPDFGRVQTTFANGDDFTRNDSYGDELWNSLVPIPVVGAGYIRVPNPRQYTLLPQSEAIEDKSGKGYAEMYQASVVHQLHCLGILRNITRSYETGLPLPNGQWMHVRHCIEYVRQTIMCTADTTLEHANTYGAFNADGAVHECRDWNLVKAFLEDHRVDDEQPSILHT